MYPCANGYMTLHARVGSFLRLLARRRKTPECESKIHEIERDLGRTTWINKKSKFVEARP